MKKIICLAALCISNAAYASTNGFFIKPYIGADYQYASFDYQDDPTIGLNGSDLAEDSLNGGDIHIGARVHNNLGFELSYLQTEQGKKSNILGTGINSKVEFKGFTLDAMGYLPIDEAKRFELIATAGVSRLRGKVSFDGAATDTEKETETKGRFGGGAQYWITENVNVRALVRYQDADFDDSVNHAVLSTIGINWQF
jgi:opacity protein-like surface antigen